MNISRLFRRELVTIEESASLHEAAALMCDQHVGALVVVSGEGSDQVMGLVSDRDLAIDGLGRPGDPRELKVGSLVRSGPITVPADADTQQALEVMRKAGVRRLLVVNDDGSVAGLVSSDDLAEAVSKELENLVGALRGCIRREESERFVASAPAGASLFVGRVAMQ